MDAWALGIGPRCFYKEIVLPSTSVKGRIGDVSKPKAYISTSSFCSMLRINSDDDEDGFYIEVDVRGLINAEDKEHGSLIPTDVFNGAVDGVRVLTGRFENPTEAGWTIRFDCEAAPSFWCAVDLAAEPFKINVYKEKLSDIKRCEDDKKEKISGIKRSMDDFERSIDDYKDKEKISDIKRCIDEWLEKLSGIKRSMEDCERSMDDYEEKISGIKRSIDEVDSPVKAPTLTMPPP